MYAIICANHIIAQEESIMDLYGNKIAKLRSLPDPYALLYVTAKVIGGVGIGVLLANWLSTWTWWIFIVIACIIAVPVVWRVLSK